MKKIPSLLGVVTPVVATVQPPFDFHQKRKLTRTSQSSSKKVLRYKNATKKKVSQKCKADSAGLHASDIIFQVIAMFCVKGKLVKKKDQHRVDYSIHDRGMEGAYAQYMGTGAHLYFRIIMYDPASVNKHYTLLEFSVYRGPEEGKETASLNIHSHIGGNSMFPPLTNKLLLKVLEIHSFIIQKIVSLDSDQERSAFWDNGEYKNPPMRGLKIAK